jgi:hypothetical protein
VALAAVATLGCSFIVGVSGDPVVVADGDAALGVDALEAASVNPGADVDADADAHAAGDGPGDAPAE